MCKACIDLIHAAHNHTMGIYTVQAQQFTRRNGKSVQYSKLRETLSQQIEG